MNLFLFNFSTAIDEPPTGSQVRFNATDYPAVTKVWVRTLTSDGQDVYRLLIAAREDDHLYLQDKDDHTRAILFTISDIPVDKGTYIELPVVWEKTDTLLANAQQVLFIVVQPGDEAVPDVEPEPPDVEGVLTFTRVEIRDPLIALAEAKEHCKIRDDYHDAEVGRFVLAAQNGILDYLKRGADPAWTEETLPLHIRASMLYLLVHLWKHRGDDMSPTESGATPDAAVWDAIDRILARSRDPALA